jgi:hypothetical protein
VAAWVPAGAVLTVPVSAGMVAGGSMLGTAGSVPAVRLVPVRAVRVPAVRPVTALVTVPVRAGRVPAVRPVTVPVTGDAVLVVIALTTFVMAERLLATVAWLAVSGWMADCDAVAERWMARAAPWTVPMAAGADGTLASAAAIVLTVAVIEGSAAVTAGGLTGLGWAVG